MSVVDIVFGDLFGANPLVGAKQIDNTLGTAKYALARVGTTTPPTSAGIFATITFTAKSTAGTYPIDITSIGLADENFADILGTVITDGSVTVLGGPVGTINVSSNLSGATFSITGPANYSGTAPKSWSDAPVGEYTLVWGDMAGYTKPADETQTLTDGGTINFDGVYVVESQWTDIFQDTQRGTTLYVNTLEGTFRLTGPDGYDTGVVKARSMRSRDGWIWIWHMDDNFHFNFNANSDSGYCYAYLWDFDTMEYYILSVIPTHWGP
jgi:hypothetical protein